MDEDEYGSYFATTLLQNVMRHVRNGAIDVSTPQSRMVCIMRGAVVKDCYTMLCPLRPQYYLHLTFPANATVSETLWQRRFQDAMADTAAHTDALFSPLQPRRAPNYRLFLSKQRSWKSMFAAIHGPDDP